MDLVDLIQEKRFLGQEFLAWLWYKSEERGGSVEVPGRGDVLVVFEKHMLLEYGEGEANEKVICRGLQTELKEAWPVSAWPRSPSRPASACLGRPRVRRDPGRGHPRVPQRPPAQDRGQQ